MHIHALLLLVVLAQASKCIRAPICINFVNVAVHLNDVSREFLKTISDGKLKIPPVDERMVKDMLAEVLLGLEVRGRFSYEGVAAEIENPDSNLRKSLKHEHMKQLLKDQEENTPVLYRRGRYSVDADNCGTLVCIAFGVTLV
jgi:hypothetical protein